MKMSSLKVKTLFCLSFAATGILAQAYMLEKDGKKVSVTKKQFLEHFVSQAKGKYVLVTVPDG